MSPLKLGHVHLKIRDLNRSVAFYTNYLGLQVTERVGPFAFLADGEIHHSVALQELGLDAQGPMPYAVGLYHTAFEVPDEATFNTNRRRLEAELNAVSVDHGISWAIYFNDPDGNGVEVYLDRRAHLEEGFRWSGRSTRLPALPALADNPEPVG